MTTERNDGYVAQGVRPTPTKAPAPGRSQPLSRQVDDEVYAAFAARGYSRSSIRNVNPDNARRVIETNFGERSDEERRRAYETINREYQKAAQYRLRAPQRELVPGGGIVRSFASRTVNQISGRNVIEPPRRNDLEAKVGAVGSALIFPEPRSIHEIEPWELALIEMGMPASGIAQAAKTMSQSTKAALAQTRITAPVIAKSAAARVRELQIDERGSLRLGGDDTLRPIEQFPKGTTPPLAGQVRGPPGPPIKGRPTGTGSGGGGGGGVPLTARTLGEMNNEARGQSVLTPLQRATMNASRKPIDADNVLFSLPEDLREFTAPALQHNAIWDSIPGKIAGRVLNPGAVGEQTAIRSIGHIHDVAMEALEGQAKTAAAQWMGEANRVFKFDHIAASGKVRLRPGYVATAVRAAKDVIKDKNFGKIADMIEHPERYQFTDEQTRLLRVFSDTPTQMLRDSQTRLGADLYEGMQDYVQRITKRGPQGEWPLRRPNSQAPRSFNFHDELRATGRELIDDPQRILEERLSSGVRTYVNQWAKNEVAKIPEVAKGLTQERIGLDVMKAAKDARTARDVAKAAYVAANSPEGFLALQESEAAYVQAQAALIKAGRAARHPGFTEVHLAGRIVPWELRQEADRYLPGLLDQTRPSHWINSHIQDLIRLIRTITLTSDASYGFVQGQQLFFRNHVAWWKSMGQAMYALVDEPRSLSGADFAIAQEGMQAGAIIRPTEMLFSRRGLSSIPTRIPLLKEPFVRFNRGFEHFTFRGQFELYKAGRTRILAQNPDGGAEAMNALADLGTAIRRELGTESYAILGIGATQRSVEALLAFAPRFYRANAFILGQALTGGAGGMEAKRALGSMLAGGLALSAGAQWALNGKGLNFDDPESADWLQVQVGESYFNMFGPFYPLFRATARTTVYLQQGEKEKAWREWQRYATSKASFPIRITQDVGRLIFQDEFQDFEGNLVVKADDSTLERTKQGLVYGLGAYGKPITYDTIASGVGGGRPESGASFFGMQDRYSPTMELDRHFREQQDINPEGRPLRDANYEQRLEMGRRFPKLADKLDETGRGDFGRVERAQDAAEREVHGQLVAEFQRLMPLMESGDTEADNEFRSFYEEKIRELSVRRIQANKDFGKFERDDFDVDKIKDPLDKALFSYWALYRQEIAQGGVLRPGSGSVDFIILDRRLAELQAGWTEQQKLYVETNRGPQNLPPELQDYDRLQRWRRQSGWHEYYQKTPDFINDTPEFQSLYEEAKLMERDGPLSLKQWKDELYQEYGKKEADFRLAWIGEIDKAVAREQYALRADNPEMDYLTALYLGSPPALRSTQARLAMTRTEARQLGVVMYTDGNGDPHYIAENHLDVLRGLGIFSLEQLAGMSIGVLAAQRGIGTKLARAYIADAQALLAAMRKAQAA